MSQENPMSRFQNKLVLVTGGTSGIGLATAKRLVHEGAKVLVTGTNPTRIEAANGLDGITAISNDAGNVDAADALAAAVKTHLGGLDAAFFNAGFGRFQALGDVTADEFDAQYAVNVRGPLLHAKALAPIIADGGAFVFNTSIVQGMGMPNMAIYGSTKAALRTVVRVLARELSPRNVRVNAVSPGPIDSGFFDRTGMPPEAIEGFAQQIVSQVPLGRFGTAEEVAAVATFLLSSDASFVTGSEYVVDGGLSEL
jgi:NAD(P)-dependent dehydrogenase (short-subunit alcohol dehydrogenase family)